MPVAWDDDSPGDARQLAANVAAVLHRIVEEADQPQMPTVAMAQQWHRDLYTGIELPIVYFAGEVRDTDPAYPELVGYEVRVGRHLAVASCDVPAALERFTADIRTAVAAVDDAAAPKRDRCQRRRAVRHPRRCHAWRPPPHASLASQPNRRGRVTMLRGRV